MRRVLVITVSGLVLSGLAIWWLNSGAVRSDPANTADSPRAARPAPLDDVPSTPDTPAGNWSAFYDPLVIAPCNLLPISEQDVSSQVDGVVDDIKVELGQQVAIGTLLCRLDDRQLRAQVALLEIRAGSVAAEKIAKAQFDEADAKVQYALKANESGLTTVPELEYKTYLFQRERFAQEIRKAMEEREAAQKELEKARVVLESHTIRTALGGEIVKVYKRNGESVKQAEPLFRIARCDALRVEGLCKVQQAGLIRVGMKALLEPELRGEQMTELLGHTAGVNAVAVSAEGRRIASASDDRSVILWSWPQGARLAAFLHPAEATAVAIAGHGVLLTGCADGQGRLWKIDHPSAPPVPLSQTHEGAIRATAFNADGSLCATGGEDKRIGIWDAVTGQHLYWLQGDDAFSAHQGTVTSLSFAPDGCLISAGRDNTVKVWRVIKSSPRSAGAEGSGVRGELIASYAGRSGETTDLGVSPDGHRLLFDMGEELRILEREGGTCIASLRNQKQGRFQNFARFSPSGNLLLTAASNGRLQLWRAPASAAQTQFFRQGYAHGFQRGSLFALTAEPGIAGLGSAFLAGPHSPAPRLWQLPAQEVRHFVAPGGSTIQCGVFAPDESVIFTGGSDKAVRVWAVPPESVWRQPLEARITYVGSQIERGADMVRIRAEIDNPLDPDQRLRAGLNAVMRLFPETR